jgi:hypothetical protein
MFWNGSTAMEKPRGPHLGTMPDAAAPDFPKRISAFSVFRHGGGAPTRNRLNALSWLANLPQRTGGRQRLGRISKQGDVYIRRLLVLGGTSLVRHARGAGGSVWAKQLLARRPTRIVTVALANKAARVIWALLTRGDVYRAPQPQAARSRISGKCRSERQGEGGEGPSVGPTTEANPLRGDAHRARNPNRSLARRSSIKASGHWPRE